MDMSSFQDSSSVHSLLEALESLGIRRLDSGARYPPLNPGRSEALLGETRTISRKFHIDTKVYMDVQTDGSGDLTAAAIARSVSGSLQRLKLEEHGVNVLHAHRADPSTPIQEQIEAFNQQIELGRCREWGVSNVPSEKLEMMLSICEEKGYRKPSCYQGDYNLITRGMETRLLPILRAHSMSFNAFRPLAAGFLTGKLINNEHQDTRFGDSNPLGKAAQKLFGAEDLHTAMKDFYVRLKPYGISPLEVTIRWIMYHSALQEKDGVIIGASKAEQVQQVVGMIENGPLPSEISQLADDLWNAVRESRGGII
ncbi:MAG: hypothetical protein Q9222_003392 [Ikaeria aurantiellina]